MNDDEIIVVSTLAGALTGVVVGKAIFPLSLVAIVVVVALGAMGTKIGDIIVANRKKLEVGDRNDYLSTETPRQTSKTFRKRLAHFMGRDESEVMVKSRKYRSRMPFWMAIDALVRVPPKSARLIRHYLVSIRKAVRGK